MKVISIQLSGPWVLEHRTDDVLPVELLKNTVQKEFEKQVAVRATGLSSLELEVKEGEVDAIVCRLRAVLSERYGDEINDNVLKISVEEEEEKEPAGSFSDAAEELRRSMIERIRRQREEREEAEEKRLGAEDMIGGKEFKELLCELRRIAPQIVENNTFETLSNQSYIFSINDGYGLSTFLSVFADELKKMKLKSAEHGVRVSEIKLTLPQNDNKDPLSSALDSFRHSGGDRTTLFCFDISEWINKTDTKQFKDFLGEIARNMGHRIVVFRVPFVDKEILDRLRRSLNDLMFVRTVSFPPFDKAEIRRFAQKELERCGFCMSKGAWACFDERIIEEKSDGKFYGVHTIRKVVRELLYKKQLSNAEKGKNDRSITKRDALALCSEERGMSLGGYEMLDRLVGGKVLKERINEIVSQVLLARAEGEEKTPCIHMRFVGNPGTGKTTVARIVGKILKEKGVLRIGNFFEYAGRDFCGRYIGETAPKTASICRDAYGSVLFIDEAYSLYRGDGNDRDFGREALDTLIAEMENHRTDLVVIMAGYTDEMDTLMQGNAGLASRMPYLIEFPNFTRDELYGIFVSMMTRRFKHEEEMLPAVKEYFDSIPDEVLNAKSFSNARFVRNLFERTWAKAAMRCQLGNIGTVVLTKDDFSRAITDKEFRFNVKKKNKLGFA